MNWTLNHTYFTSAYICFYFSLSLLFFSFGNFFHLFVFLSNFHFQLNSFSLFTYILSIYDHLFLYGRIWIFHLTFPIRFLCICVEFELFLTVVVNAGGGGGSCHSHWTRSISCSRWIFADTVSSISRKGKTTPKSNFTFKHYEIRRKNNNLCSSNIIECIFHRNVFHISNHSHVFSHSPTIFGLYLFHIVSHATILPIFFFPVSYARTEFTFNL